MLPTLKNKRGEINFHNVSVCFIYISTSKILLFQHVALVTIQVLDNHMWPMATALDSMILEWERATNISVNSVW